jgi:hypothetical protein
MMVAVRMNEQSPKRQEQQDEAAAGKPRGPENRQTPERAKDRPPKAPADGQVIAEKGDELGGPA